MACVRVQSKDALSLELPLSVKINVIFSVTTLFYSSITLLNHIVILSLYKTPIE